MKKTVIVFVFFISVLSVFAQSASTVRLPAVGIQPFEISGTGVTEADAAEATRLVIAELSSWEAMNILSGDQARTAEYLIRGQISRQDNQLVLSATTVDNRTGRTLNNSKEQASALREVNMESFCAQVSENIPYPNYLQGKWRSTIEMVDGPVICILEFRSDRTVRVEQFDTWEHNGTNSLKYQAIGTGNYSYAGYRRRTVSVGGRQVVTDATVGVNLSLEDSLPKYKTVSSSGLRVLFDDSKTSFELSYGGIPCGDNFSGQQVYPSANVYYTKFIKIQ